MPRSLSQPVIKAAALILSIACPLNADPPHDETDHVCGKARAMSLRAQREVVDPGDVLRLEAMEATDVLHCDLDIEVSNLNTSQNNCTITGTNVMTIQSKSAGLTEFTFRLRTQFTITSAFINGTTPVTVTALSTTTRRAALDRPYLLDEIFTLTINYTGTTVSAGFGSIEVESQSGIPVVATLSEPYYAYTWWPVKDGDVFEPGDNSDKFTLDFSIIAPNNYEVPANGLLVSVDNLGGGRNRYNWSSSYPIVPYLVAFAATDYNTWTVNYNYPGGSMPVQFFIYPSNDNSSNRAGWERAVDMLTAFVPVYGQYPFINEKYGIYNFPFGGGMEHQTMTGQSGFSESLTAHELAHQWWGDAITCATWSDIWLNEGFATFSECLWEERKNGQNMAAYRSCMASRRPSAVGDTVYVYDTSSVSRIFSSNYSYRKGAWVVHMLRGLLGETLFFQTLADYRANFEDSAATTDDLAAVASTTAGQDLTFFFDQWVYEGGAPAYRYGWDTAKVDGQDRLLLRIEQTQLSGYPPVFTMPVQIDAVVGGFTETITVWNDQRTQWFSVPVSGEVSSITFDPETWILWTSATSTTYVAGDLNGDLTVGGSDHNLFVQCYTDEGGQLAAGCEPADFDGDGDIDCTDWDAFSTAWSVGSPPDFAPCAGPSEPLPATDFVGAALKNRYVSFQPPQAALGTPHAYMVTHPASGQSWYISTPRTTPVHVAGRGITFLVSDAAPPLHDFSTLPTVHVGGCMIAPGESYEVTKTEDGAVFTGPLVVTTAAVPGSGRWWADVVGSFSTTGDFLTNPPTPANSWTPPNGTVNGFDVTAVLEAFRDVPTAPDLTWTDMNPQVPDRLSNGADILQVVNAFSTGSGREFYPFDVPLAPGPQGQAACPAPPLMADLDP